MTNQAPHGREREQGLALLVTMFILFLIAAIAMTSIRHSGEEAAGSSWSPYQPPWHGQVFVKTLSDSIAPDHSKKSVL